MDVGLAIGELMSEGHTQIECRDVSSRSVRASVLPAINP
jgi:hypothetical protein